MEDPTFPIPNLPNDLIFEILTRLPVKSLLKSKSVCKSWRALISSPQFVKSHLENSKLDRNFTTQRVLMQRTDVWPIDQGDFTTLSYFKQVSANSVIHEPVSEAFDLSWPYQPDSLIMSCLGSCNGLLCLITAFPIPGTGKYYGRIELILWNPSTRIRNVYSAADDDPSLTKYGFGYDKSSDDYKVVRFFCGDKDSSESEVMLQVYSLRNDHWKTAKPLRMRPLEMLRPATFVNGKLYWIGFEMVDPEDKDLFVVCFDLETEEHEILQFPNGIWRKYWLGECEGSLRLMCFHISGLDVWSLDDCKKWSKVVRVPNVDNNLRYCGKVLYVMNSIILFLGCGSIAIFDAKDYSIRYHEIRSTWDFTVIGACIESLVSPLGW